MSEFIHMTLGRDSIWGHDPDAQEGVNVSLSEDTLAEMTAAALQEEFPDAEIVVELADSTTSHWVKGNLEDDDLEFAQIISGRVWETWEWIVMEDED